MLIAIIIWITASISVLIGIRVGKRLQQMNNLEKEERNDLYTSKINDSFEQLESKK